MIGEALALGAAVVVAVRLAVWRSNRRLDAWRRAMRTNGLVKLVERDGSLTGRARRLRVWFESGLSREGRVGLRITVAGPGAPLSGLSVYPRHGHPPGTTQPLIGDEAFDATFRLRGALPLVRARMSGRTRELLLEAHSAMRSGDVFEVLDGMLYAHLLERPRDVEAPSRALGTLIYVARHLPQAVRPPGIVASLVANASRDEEPGVRLENLRVLTQEFGGNWRTAKALETGCGDPSPRVRLFAAASRGAAGMETLLALAADPSAGDECAAGAVRALGGWLPFATAATTLARAHAQEWDETVHACLDRLATGGDEAVAPLVAVLDSARGAIAVHAARALADTGSKAAEAPLIAALDRAFDVRTAAAEALSRCGTVEAVLPLQQAEQRYAGSAFPEAARKAVAAIQSRLSGVDHGQLALADGDAGRLSFPVQEGGELSLADAKLPRDGEGPQ